MYYQRSHVANVSGSTRRSLLSVEDGSLPCAGETGYCRRKENLQLALCQVEGICRLVASLVGSSQ